VRRLATLGIAVFVGVLVTVPALAMMIAPAFLDQGVNAHDLGPLSEFPQGEFVWTTFTSDPAQGAVSRRTAFVRDNGLVAGQLSFTILSGRSSYLGCPVQPNGTAFLAQEIRFRDVTLRPVDAKGFGSACHPLPGTQYDTEGSPTGGPTTRPLDRYTYSIRDGHLFVGAPYSVSRVEGSGAAAKIDAVPFAFPGEPVSGVESWLYPLRPSM
jgi:Rieske Fe-S protein